MKSWRLVTAAVFTIPTVVTVIIVIWEWLENPSGIFHDENGTNWGFVYETAVSWFVPMFLIAAGVGIVAFLVRLIIGRLRIGRQ